MPQGFNRGGVAAFARLTYRPGLRPLAIPHARLRDIRSIPFSRLRDRGVKGIVFDKDNTLTLPYAATLHAPLEPAIHRAKQIFGDNHLAVLSNSVGSSDDVGFKEASRLENVLQMRVVRHGTKKPHGIEAVRAMFPDAKEDELVFVGDRFFTDVVFGNMHGMLTVHVEPFTSKGDNLVVRLIRSMEADIVRGWIKRASPPPHRLYSPDLFETEAGAE